MIAACTAPTADRPEQLPAVTLLDQALACVGGRDALPRDEAVAMARSILDAIADTDRSRAAAQIVNELVEASTDALLVGSVQAADAFLDLRLVLAPSP